MTDQNETDRSDRSSSGVSAIVISYYTGPVLGRSLSSLANQPEIKEIILVDNGNFPGAIDKTLAGLEGAVPVKLLSGHGNIGFAAACNKGAAAAAYEFLLFFNPDAIMPEGGVAKLLAGGAELDRPWMMGARLVDPDGVEQQGSRREVLTPWKAFVEAGRLYRLAPRHPYFKRFNLHKEECPEKVSRVPTISGACIFLPKDDYELIGGMDERYFLHVEDVDFCLRFAEAGGKVYFNPHVDVVHFKSSSRASPVRIEARKTAGMILYFNTHFSDAYPRVFLWLLAGLLWLNFGVLFVRRGVSKLLRLFRMAARTGWRGVKKGVALWARRTTR